jgi:hypothetical protein
MRFLRKVQEILGGNGGTGVKTTTLAKKITNYAICQFKNQIVQISEMETREQEDIGDTIRNTALRIFNEFDTTPAVNHVEA